jgi:hypothetical protein
MALTPDMGVVLPALVGGAIGTIIGERRLVRRQMPEHAARWFALSLSDRLRIRWAVAWGNAVADIRLAPLAAVLAQARRVTWEQLSWTRYVTLWVIAVAVAVASIVALRDDGGIFYGGVSALSCVAEMIVGPGRGARLERAERRNLALSVPA